MYVSLWTRLYSSLACWRCSLILAILLVKKVLHSQVTFCCWGLVVRVGLYFSLGDCYRYWRLPWNHSCCYEVTFCRNPFQLCHWCCTQFDVCRRLGIYHCCLCLSARFSQVFFIFLLQLWLCHLSMVASVYEISSWVYLEVKMFPSADLETYFIIPQSHQVICNLHGMVLPLGLHLLGDWYQWLLSFCMTLVSLLWLLMVFEVWNRWGCGLVLVILFLSLWWY